MLAMFCITFSPLSISAENRILSACGATQDEARKELGKSLQSNVASSSSKKVSVITDDSSEQVKIIAQTTDDQFSKIALCNVKVAKEGGQYCASVSHKELSECASNKLDAQMSYLVNNLPETESVRLKKAKEWLDDIVLSTNLYTYVGNNEFDEEKLNKLISIENNLLKLLDNQYVRFDIEGATVKIKLGGSKIVQPNIDTAMKIGSYAYEISSPGYCTVKGNVDLTEKARSTVKYDMSKYTHPVITFTSNLPNVQLKVDGKNSNVGESKTMTKCEGTLAYLFTIQGVTKEGTVNLKPGLKAKIRGKFTSPADLTIAKSYRSGQLWQVFLHNIFPSYANNQIDKLSGFKISKSNLKDSFRWGYQASFATDGKNAYAYELSAAFSLQLLDYNNGREALTLGPLVIVPSAGFDIGLAYHDLDGIRSFEDADASEWKKIYQSYGVFRPKLNIDATFNKDFGFSLSYSRSVYMNKSNIFSIGMGFKF